MFVAMKREIPEPRPYPFWRSSSKHRTMIPANHNWLIIRTAFPTPSCPILPYIPERTYATASPIAMKIPNNFWAPFLRTKRKHHERDTEQNLTKYYTIKDIQKINVFLNTSMRWSKIKTSWWCSTVRSFFMEPQIALL